jgi:hypothetical protein
MYDKSSSISEFECPGETEAMCCENKVSTNCRVFCVGEAHHSLHRQVSEIGRAGVRLHNVWAHLHEIVPPTLLKYIMSPGVGGSKPIDNLWLHGMVTRYLTDRCHFSPHRQLVRNVF